MSHPTNPFPPIRRVVTGHDDRGLAVVQSDERFASQPIALGGAEFALLWTTPTVPADNNDPTDGRQREAGLTIHQGSVIRVVDFLPVGDLQPETVNETIISDSLYTANMPEPDLLIRTAGELRVSNFLLWQISYAEIWVTEKCWPDFDVPTLHQALRDYSQRVRRFGGLPEN